uniref:Uncharacterized protein n=1 Tax=Anguilla anguilla TaxID=7936 RepID=A0A0E9X8A7_ANGAN
MAPFKTFPLNCHPVEVIHFFLLTQTFQNEHSQFLHNLFSMSKQREHTSHGFKKCNMEKPADTKYSSKRVKVGEKCIACVCIGSFTTWMCLCAKGTFYLLSFTIIQQ